MRLWPQTRQDAISEGIAIAAALGLAGIEVLHAPEISTVRMLEERGIRSVLRDILPSIRPNYISYSSYESLDREDPVTALTEDIHAIRTITNASQVIIGEAGYSRARWREMGVQLLEAVIRWTLESDVAYLICWNLNDQGAHEDFGLFDNVDRLTPSGHLIERMLRSEVVGQATSQTSPHSTRE